MQKSSKIQLILSCVFVTVAFGFIFLEGLFIAGTIGIFNSESTEFGEALGKAFGGVIMYAYAIACAFFGFVGSVTTIILDSLFIKKEKARWYTTVMLIASIVMILLSVLLLVLVPAIGSGGSSSSSSI